MRTRALAAAVVALGVLLTSCGAVGESPSKSDTPVPVGLEAGCPAPATEVRFPEGGLAAGATRVRLCPGPPLTDVTGNSIQAPADLLTSNVETLVNLVNSQREVEGDLECTADEGPVLVFWFGYPGGDWRAVQFGSYGCNLLTLGEDLRRRGGAALSAAFTTALTTQRDSQQAPRSEDPVPCPASPITSPRSGLVLDEIHLAAAAWCVSPRTDQVREVAIPPALLERLSTGLWPGITTQSRRRCPDALSSWIEGITPWGDSISFGIGPCGDIYPQHGATLLDDHGSHYLAPELDAALMALPLGPLVKPTEQASASQCPSWDAEPTYALGDLPVGAINLRVCSGDDPDDRSFQTIAVPAEALTTGVDELVSLVNALPDWEPPEERFFCTQEYTSAINYVFGYADGSTRSVTYGYGGCGLLELEPPGDFPDADTLAKDDPARLFDAVNAALSEQRRTTTPPPPQTPAIACEPATGPVTMLPLADLELLSASLCLSGSQVLIRGSLLDRLRAALATASPGETPPTCDDHRSARVVGTSTWGDPVAFYVGPCHSFGLVFTPGLATFGFELPADLAGDVFALTSER